MEYIFHKFTAKLCLPRRRRIS